MLNVNRLNQEKIPALAIHGLRDRGLRDRRGTIGPLAAQDRHASAVRFSTSV